MSEIQSALRRIAAIATGARGRGPVACIAAVLVLAPLAAVGQGSALDAALFRREQRLAEVDIYVQRNAGSQLPGIRLGLPDGDQGPCTSDCVVYKVEPIQRADGTPGWRERALDALEVQTLAGLSPGADFADIYGGVLIDFQSMFNSFAGAGLGAGLGMMMGGSEPWLDPYQMFAAGGFMMQEAASGLRAAEQSLATSGAQAQAEANQAGQLFAQLEPAGVEQLEGGPATRFNFAAAATGPIQMDTFNGEPVFLESGSVWIDLENEVIAAHRIEGTMTQDGESRPFFLEVRNEDYREVPGCSLYEPYRRVMRMGGMLDDAQMAEMEEARQKLAEFDQQMAAMSPAERAMMEGMLGSQMATVRNMANSGAIEHVQEIEEIICNPDLAALFGGGGSVQDLIPVVDLAQIQRDLVTLGYEPGNTDGVLDTLTQIAISQYQAERGMAVTGEPSPVLADALSAEVARQ